MKERGIIFSAPMVRAILLGRKTQTRRLAKSPACPFSVGQMLWVRETFVLGYDANPPTDGRPFQIVDHLGGCAVPHYRATEPDVNYCGEDQDSFDDRTRWTPSIYMPRWASRIILEITDVRLERLQDISEADVIAEGVGSLSNPHRSPKESFRELWDSLHGKAHPWLSNPMVFCITFHCKEQRG